MQYYQNQKIDIGIIHTASLDFTCFAHFHLSECACREPCDSTTCVHCHDQDAELFLRQKHYPLLATLTCLTLQFLSTTNSFSMKYAFYLCDCGYTHVCPRHKMCFCELQSKKLKTTTSCYRKIVGWGGGHRIIILIFRAHPDKSEEDELKRSLKWEQGGQFLPVLVMSYWIMI